MKSEQNQYNKKVVELIDKIFDDHEQGELALVCVETNGEVVIGFVDAEEEFLNDGYTVVLPVHLMEYTGYDENDMLYASYKFLPYRQLSDRVSELNFMKRPDVIFTPSDDIVESFVLYWLRYTQELSCDNNIMFDIMTATKS